MEKKLVVDGEEWDFYASRGMPFWHQALSNYGYFKYVKSWGLHVPLRLLFLVEQGVLTHLFRTGTNALDSNEDTLNLFSSKAKILSLRKKYERFGDELIQAMRTCKKSFSLKNWQKFSEAYARYIIGLYITSIIGRVGLEHLIQLLKKAGFSENEIPSIVATITYPKSHTPLFNSSLDLLKVAKKVQSGDLSEAKQNRLLEKWLEKHGYIPVNYCDEPWSLADAKQQLGELLKKNAQSELENVKKSHIARVKEMKSTLKKINNPKIELAAFGLQEGTFLNEYRKNVFSNVSFHMRPLFEKIRLQGGLSFWRDCFFLLPQEIESIIQGKLKNAHPLVQKRAIVAMATLENGKTIFLDDSNTQKIMDFINSTHKKTEESVLETSVKGFSASKGIARGTAKIIFETSDFSKFNAGDILIARMTSVDFVPIMEKAAAFVTNEGGITSHASIVAREMNKPCVIGTKNATQVFKDGDLVEVDADAGTVRKIG